MTRARSAVARLAATALLLATAGPAPAPAAAHPIQELGVESCGSGQDEACLTAAARAALAAWTRGVPALGVAPQDPLPLRALAFDISGLQFTLRDGQVRGLRNAHVDSLKWSQGQQQLTLRFHMDASLRGRYTAAGRLLILPIQGDGDFKMKVRRMEVTLRLATSLQDGHYQVGKHSVDFEIKDNAHFTLTNLFNGNKELSDTLHAFLNSSWQQVAAEFGAPLVQAAADAIVDNIAAFFRAVPAAQLLQG